MVELGTRRTIERVRVGNSPSNAACAVFLSRPPKTKPQTVQRVELLIKDLNLELEYRRVVEPGRAGAIKGNESGRGNEGIFCGAAIDLGNGTIITGDNSP
ncbi:MAG: hypothetical protein GY762_21990 [Proteobacteria bacterium]|nr:hypothetical protein [Pseudomonadota bacterium]